MFKKITLFLIFICYSVSAQTSYRNLSTENWTFNKQHEVQKHKATIPGTIHTDLFQNQLIPDPFLVPMKNNCNGLKMKTGNMKPILYYQNRN
nr:hypothetical protein [Flavobacterium piscinae]